MSGERRTLRDSILADVILIVFCAALLFVHVTVRRQLERIPGKARTYWYDPHVGGIVEFETNQTLEEIDDPGAWARRTVREALIKRRATQGLER